MSRVRDAGRLSSSLSPDRRLSEGAGMKIFVAGGTGVLGRRIIPVLVNQGHEVTALTRRSDQTGMLPLAPSLVRPPFGFGGMSIAVFSRPAVRWLLDWKSCSLPTGKCPCAPLRRLTAPRWLLFWLDSCYLGNVAWQIIPYAARDFLGPLPGNALDFESEINSVLLRPARDDPAGNVAPVKLANVQNFLWRPRGSGRRRSA